jgi:hypothetical protein
MIELTGSGWGRSVCEMKVGDTYTIAGVFEPRGIRYWLNCLRSLSIQPRVIQVFRVTGTCPSFTSYEYL